MQTVAEFMLEQLAAWGVRHIYGVIGDAILPLMDAVARQNGIRFIPVHHESAAGFMATAEAKLTGRLAVCTATSGPGLANLVNGLGDAYADRVPILLLTGQVESYKVGTDVKQYVDQQLMVQGLVGYSAGIAGPGAAPGVLVRALKTAIGEGRAAQVSVPKDYWKAPVQASIHPAEPFLTAPPVVAESVIEGAAKLLRGAARPLILAGHGARPAAGDLLALAEAWGAGVILALGGKGMVDGRHPLVLGGVGQGSSKATEAALKETDLILVVGSTWWPAQYMPKKVPVVQIDRSPANIGSQVAVAYGLAGDCRQVVPALVQALHRESGADRGAWTKKLSELVKEWEATLASELTEGGPVAMATLVEAIERHAPPGTVISLDTGDHVLWFNRHFRGNGHQLLFSGTWRTMGYGLPAAAAAKLSAPEDRVIALTGDGGLNMLLGGLALPAQQRLDLTVVVSRNGSLLLEQHKAEAEGLQPLGHELCNPDFAAVARAFGWRAWTVERSDQLTQALGEAVAYPGPALVEVHTASRPNLMLPPG